MKLKSTLWALAFACAAVSCSDDLDDGPNNNGNDNGEKGESAWINVAINTGTVTKAAPGEDGDKGEVGLDAESKVNNVMVILYKNADETKDGFSVLSTSTIEAVGYTSTVSEMKPDGGVSGHYWSTPVKVEVTDKATSLADKKFGVITVTNAGDLTEDIKALKSQTIGALGDMIMTEVKGSGVSNFVMSTHTVGGASTRLEPSTITLVANATEGTAPSVNVYVERLAAKIRIGEGTGITGFKYEVTEGTTPVADVKLNSVAIVNQLSSGSYLLKRVTDPDTNYDPDNDLPMGEDADATNDQYLGDERKGGTPLSAVNFVIDPWTRLKTFDITNGLVNPLPTVSDVQLAYTQPFQGSSYADMYGDFTSVNLGDETDTDKFSDEKTVDLCYTMENTTSVTASRNGYSTGAIFKATYYPKAWWTTTSTDNATDITYDGATGGDNTTATAKSFYVYGTVIYENREAIFARILKNINDSNFPWTNFESEQTYSEALKTNFEASALADAVDPFGYVAKIKECLNASENIPAFSTFVGDDQSYLDKDVRYYEDGICYYPFWIRHADNSQNTVMGVQEFGIVRNNIYDMAVTKIGKLGLSGDEVPDPKDPDESDQFLFNVLLHVKNWVVRSNDNIIF